MIEYRVKPITRYVVTRYEDASSGGYEQPATVTERGTFDNHDTAFAVAHALCNHEHCASGEPLDSMSFIYPRCFDSDGVSVIVA